MRHVEKEIDNLLDRYLEGVLTKEEVRLLHRQLEEDLPSGEVQDLLDHIKLPDDVLNPSAINPKKEVKIYYKHALPHHNRPKKQPEKSPFLYVVVIILLLIIPLIFYILPIQQRQKMFDRYYKPYSITAVQATFDNQALADQWRTAVFKYNNDNYLQAAKTLESLLDKQASEKYIIDFYVGLCYLSISESELALVHLNPVAEGINPLHHQATWYAALAQLQLNELEKAKNILQNIVQMPDSYNSDEAKEILKRLE